MKTMVYLLSVWISGIKNIEKEICIDFFGKNIDKKFNPEKNRVKGIYGENGTGKTAIISAVRIVREFIFDNNYLRDPKNQLILSELINKDTREFVFRCSFVTNIESFLIFEYEVHFSFDENEEIFVSYESLKYKCNSSKNKQKTLFICANGEFSCLNIDEMIKKEVVEKSKNLLDRQSALYTVYSFCVNTEKRNITSSYIAFAVVFFLVMYAHCDKEDIHTDYYQKIRLKELRERLSADGSIRELLNGIPTNEKRIPLKMFNVYENGIRKLELFVKLFKPELRKIIIEKRINKDHYECELLMDYGKYVINREFESTGIKKIMELFDAFRMAANGFVVFIDEMDSNINDIYLCKIIEYYKLYGAGQLCFTSHNTDPMIVLRENNKSIDFLTRDNRIVPWVKNGHYTPENSYRNGMIEGMPFNIDSSDFVSIFGRE